LFRSKEKIDDFYENLDQVFDYFPKYNMKILLDFNEKVRREVFSNRQMGMRIYIRLVIIMVLE